MNIASFLASAPVIDLTRSLGLFFVMAYKDHDLWCFLFVTLFNLQGARPLRRNIAIITAQLEFVNCFFDFFSSPSSCLPPRAPLSHSFVRIPNPALFVNPFSSLFSCFFIMPSSFPVFWYYFCAKWKMGCASKTGYGIMASSGPQCPIFHKYLCRYLRPVLFSLPF